MYTKRNKVVAVGLWLNIIFIPWLCAFSIALTVELFNGDLSASSNIFWGIFTIFISFITLLMLIWTIVILATDQEILVWYTVLTFFANVISFILFIICYIAGMNQTTKPVVTRVSSFKPTS